MLHHRNFNKRFFINCDASNISLGSELYQEDDEGNHMVISFASRILSSCERNYTVTEKELLSVIFACLKFRTFILGYPVTIRTDHRSISFLRNCKLNHGRLTRRVLILQEYNLDWEYVPGKKNIVADGLSRVNLEKGTFEVEQENIGRIYHVLKSREELQEVITKVKEDQNTDPKLIKIRDRIKGNDSTLIPFFCIHEELIFTRPTIRDPVSYTHLDVYKRQV